RVASLGFAVFHDGQGTAKDATFCGFRFVEDRECRAETQLFGVARVDAGDERADEAVEKSGREFAASEIGDGFVGFWRAAGTKEIAKNGEARAAAQERREEQARAHGDVLQLVLD